MLQKAVSFLRDFSPAAAVVVGVLSVFGFLSNLSSDDAPSSRVDVATRQLGMLVSYTVQERSRR